MNHKSIQNLADFLKNMVILSPSAPGDQDAEGSKSDNGNTVVDDIQQSSNFPSADASSDRVKVDALETHIKTEPGPPCLGVTGNNLSLLAEEIRTSLAELLPSAGFLAFDFPADGLWNSSYFPFLDLLQELYKSRDDVERMVQRYCYQPQQEVFCSVLRGTAISRTDPLFDVELAFERQKFQQGIADLIRAAIGNTLTLVYLAGVEHMHRSAVGVFRQFLEEPGNIRFICGFYDEPDVRIGTASAFSSIFESNMIPQISRRFSKSQPPRSAVDAPSLADKIDLLEKSCALFDSELAVLQAEDLQMPGYSDDLQLRLGAIEQGRLQMILGRVHRFSGQYRAAHDHYLRAFSIFRNSGDASAEAMCAENLSQCALLLYDRRDAEYFCQCFHDYAMQVHDWDLIARAELLRFQLQQFQNEYFKGYIGFLRKRLTILEPAFAKLGMRNALAYVLSNETMISSMLKANEGVKETIDFLLRALDIAAEIGNSYRLSLINHYLGIGYQALAERDTASRYYRQSIELARSLSDEKLANRLSNGVGYFFFSAGDFSVAADFYDEALRGLVRERDFAEVCSSLFNFGSINFFRHLYSVAMPFYETMLRIMDALEIGDLQYHSREIIYSLIGICAIKTGDINKGYRFHRMVLAECESPSTYSTFEYYHFFQAVMARYEGRIAECERELEKVIDIEQSKAVDEAYLVIRAYFELADLYKFQGRTEDCARTISLIRELIPEGSFPDVLISLEAMEADSGEKVFTPIVPGDIPLDFIVELAEQEAGLRRLNSQMEQMRLLNEFQDILRNYSGLGRYPNSEIRFLAAAGDFLIRSSADDRADSFPGEFCHALLEQDSSLAGKFEGAYYLCRSWKHHQAGQIMEARRDLTASFDAARNYRNFDLLSQFMREGEAFDLGGSSSVINEMVLLWRIAQCRPDFRSESGLMDIPPHSGSGNEGQHDYDQYGLLEHMLSYHALIAAAVRLIAEGNSFDFAVLAEFDNGRRCFSESLVPRSRRSEAYDAMVLRFLEDVFASWSRGEHRDKSLSAEAATQLGLEHSRIFTSGKSEEISLLLIVGGYHDDKVYNREVSHMIGIMLDQLLTALSKVRGEMLILRQNRDLEAAVKERTNELSQSLAHIERQKAQIQSYAARLEETVEERGRELVNSERRATLAQLVANLSHEISSPLGNVILLNSASKTELSDILSAAEDGTLSLNGLQDFLKRSVDSSSIIADNVNRVLDLVSSYRKVAHDQAKPEIEVVELREYLQSVFILFKPRLTRAGVELTLECPDNLTIRSYPGILSQIMSNLLINALTHAFTDDQRQKHIQLSVSSRTDVLELRFTDNGMGMDSQIRSRIFEAYFTTNKTGGGTGLGLHIIQSLVEKNLKGSISCSSAPGDGTEFFISLPLSLDDPNGPSS